MKTNKMTLIVMGLTLLNITLLNAGIAFAEDTVSAPTVVAPSQPASATTAVAVAGNAAANVPAPPAQSAMGMALPFVIMLTIMYFLMIRPQQKKTKEHQGLLAQLKNGDEVVTNSGIIGTIAGMSEKVVTLEVSKNVQMKILKSQVNQVIKGNVQDIQA